MLTKYYELQICTRFAANRKYKANNTCGVKIKSSRVYFLRELRTKKLIKLQATAFIARKWDTSIIRVKLFACKAPQLYTGETIEFQNFIDPAINQ